ncbi:MAG: hypothetical protein A2Y10_00340 [Planctomycetes bacterium GWF2_41_51]|nr:MAG: hypothetical protein A2Y10_00340 [Planctomycetes bacterium GWF2_41_51]HBG26074.1 hypothetical protein [Phycisphaerales bacterium]
MKNATNKVQLANSQSLHKEPIHRQLYQILRNPIVSGIYASGSKLPTEAELTKLYKVSRVTVRRALQELASQGLIEGRKSQGTFVRIGANIRIKPKYIFVYDNTSPITYPYLSLLLQGIQSKSQNLKFRLEIIVRNPMAERSTKDAMFSDFIELADFNGIITLPECLTQEEIFQLEKRNIPIVFVGHTHDTTALGPNTIRIECNPRQSMFLILNHLIQIGHTKVGYIGKPLSESKIHKDFICSIFDEIKLEFPIDAYEPCEYGIDPATSVCCGLLKKKPELNAIFCFDDLHAIGALQYLRTTNKRIPQEIALAGYGNLLGEHSNLDITTVDIRIKEQGAMAVSCLDDLIAGKEVKKRIWIEPFLIKRKTA